MKRTTVTALVILVLAGCEQQEAVPLSRSVPVAVLQLVVLLGSVVGGSVLLERAARRRAAATDLPAAADRRGLDVIGAVVFGALGVGVAAALALAIASIPDSYAQETVDIFSWEDSVGICWVLMVPSIPFSLFQLRLAAACWARRPWAAWGAGAQLLLIVTGILWSAAPSA